MRAYDTIRSCCTENELLLCIYCYHAIDAIKFHWKSVSGVNEDNRVIRVNNVEGIQGKCVVSSGKDRPG